MTQKRHDLVDVPLIMFHETEKAFLLGQSQGEKQWVPKSQAERDDQVRGRDKGYPLYDFTMPEWLAIEKGWA